MLMQMDFHLLQATLSQGFQQEAQAPQAAMKLRLIHQMGERDRDS
jgi:hypothetical protein